MTISLAERGVKAVLLDIEGTTTPLAFVHDVLFPYARARLREHVSESVAVHMEALMDADSKDRDLKELQGVIWERGYTDGTLRSIVYDDVTRALTRWQRAGIHIAIYSSGSVRAQQLLFAHSDQGDLTRYISAYFDTNTGPKKVAESYRRIGRALVVPPQQVFFISDLHTELSAAGEAKMQRVLSVRPGNMEPALSGEELITSFDEVTA